MSFEKLQAKVAHAEDALEAHERRAAAGLREFGAAWRGTWTPPRVIVAGLAAGVLVGWARPVRAIAGIDPTRWLQLAGSLAGLVGSVSAAFAAADAEADAEAAAGTAGDGGADGDDGAAPGAPAADARASASGSEAAAATPPSQRRYAPDPAWDAQPRPAEAATELSETR